MNNFDIMDELRKDPNELEKDRKIESIRDSFRINRAGEPKAQLANVIKALGHPDLEIYLDEFSQNIYVDGQILSDEKEAEIALFFDDVFDFCPKTSLIHEGIKMVAKQNKRNLIKEKFEKFAKLWQQRDNKISLIDSFISDYLGVKPYIYDPASNDPEIIESTNEILQYIESKHPNPNESNKILESLKGIDLIKAYSRNIFLGAVARSCFATAEKPIKFDSMLILYGVQGLGKSTLIRALCLEDRYFADDFIDMSSKDGKMALSGILLYEIKEMKTKGPRNQKIFKAFIDSSIDRIRAPYARSVTKVPRRNIFIGSTNRGDIHSDLTGSRREWVVWCGISQKFSEEAPKNNNMFNIEEIKRIAPLLWGEAYYRYAIQKEQQIWLTTEEEKLRTILSENHRMIDPFEKYAREFLNDPITNNDQICPIEMLTSGHFGKYMDKSKITKGDVARLGLIMKSLGYQRARIRKGSVRKYVFLKNQQ